MSWVKQGTAYRGSKQITVWRSDAPGTTVYTYSGGAEPPASTLSGYTSVEALIKLQRLVNYKEHNEVACDNQAPEAPQS